MIIISEIRTNPAIEVLVFKDTGKWYTTLYINLGTEKENLSRNERNEIRIALENRIIHRDKHLVVLDKIPYMLCKEE